MTEGLQTSPDTAPPDAKNPEEAVTEPIDPEAGDALDKPKEKTKITQTVDIKDVGPCKKHITVTIGRAAIDSSFEDKYKDLVGESWVPGFRPGKAPKKVVVRKFKKDVYDRVKGEILMASLEQLADEFDVAPLSPPNLNPDSIVIPDKGDMIYEFDVEVRPHFDLPEYKGLTLKKPVREFTEADVDEAQTRLLERDGQLVPKDGAVEKGDFVIVDMVTSFGNEKLSDANEITLRVDDTLTFKDGIANKFGEQMIGAKAGDKRSIDISMTDGVAVAKLKGQTVHGSLEIKDVKKLRLPELDEEYLGKLHCKTVDQLREQIRIVLERQLEFQQRQSAREQVLGTITAAATWELPQDILQRQARNALARKTMEMRESGMSADEIKARQRLLERDVLSSTAQALKEHFVMQKIAEEEKIEIDEDEINDEIERIADTYHESPRRIRAQMEREEQMETLAAQLIERKVLNLILETAHYEEVTVGKETGMATVDSQAVPGEMKDPTAAPPTEKKSDEPA